MNRHDRRALRAKQRKGKVAIVCDNENLPHMEQALQALADMPSSVLRNGNLVVMASPLLDSLVMHALVPAFDGARLWTKSTDNVCLVAYDAQKLLTLARVVDVDPWTAELKKTMKPNQITVIAASGDGLWNFRSVSMFDFRGVGQA